MPILKPKSAGTPTTSAMSRPRPARINLGRAAGTGKQDLHALIGGKRKIFATIEDKFDALVAECRRLRDTGSSTDTFFNDAYGQIVGMGTAVVPFLLRELQRQNGHWISALTWIQNEDLVTRETRGNLRRMRQAWIDWGIKNGHIAGIT